MTGLKDGSIVKVERTSIQQSTKKETWEERFYISSFSPLKENIQRVHEVIKLHWGIENNLHWCLDMRYSQDRMQANNPNYIANRSALNKLALAYLENYRYWLWDNKKEKELLRKLNELTRLLFVRYTLIKHNVTSSKIVKLFLYDSLVSISCRNAAMILTLQWNA